MPRRVERLLGDGAIVLLTALAATGALMETHDFAGWARAAGVGAGLCMALLKLPFPVVVIAAAGVTAGLRLLGLS